LKLCARCLARLATCWLRRPTRQHLLGRFERQAALEEPQRLAGDEGILPRKVLAEGFVCEGQRVPLMGPQDIFKARLLRDIPLSITTVAVVEGETRPYDDAFGEDGPPEAD
jgi:putative restriction endonuclease